MNFENFYHEIEEALGFDFTADQAVAAEKLVRFVLSPRPFSIFLLRGYAGTGKTSLVAALVQTMKAQGRKVCLLAPTGRAAKVFSLYAHTPAYTIHRAIYCQETFKGIDTPFDLGFNHLEQTLFIVDEASMIAGHPAFDSLFGSGMLLDDLMEFVYNDRQCKLLLVGDTAQLPPVGESESLALQAETMKRFGLTVTETDLTQVVRQEKMSDVLVAATRLRQTLQQETTPTPEDMPLLPIRTQGEVRYLPGDELIETLVDAYHRTGTDGTIVLTRSNKRATLYNQGIRARIFGYEDLLVKGDLVMAVKNNYYWTEQLRKSRQRELHPPFDFIANGERAEVVHFSNQHEQYGFQFADATLRFPDYDNFEMDVRVNLDSLLSDAPALTREQQRTLFERIEEDYLHIRLQKERMRAIREDPYFNAVQIKYAYAVTCHKAQGGQWEEVFVDHGWLPPDLSMVEHLRWLYTAFTRTTHLLYLINWPQQQLEHL